MPVICNVRAPNTLSLGTNIKRGCYCKLLINKHKLFTYLPASNLE